MPRGNTVAPREYTCRACGDPFVTHKTGKGTFYCHGDECDERRKREGISTPNKAPMTGRGETREAAMARAREAADRRAAREQEKARRRLAREVAAAERQAHRLNDRIDREREKERARQEREDARQRARDEAQAQRDAAAEERRCAREEARAEARRASELARLRAKADRLEEQLRPKQRELTEIRGLIFNLDPDAAMPPAEQPAASEAPVGPLTAGPIAPLQTQARRLIREDFEPRIATKKAITRLAHAQGVYDTRAAVENLVIVTLAWYMTLPTSFRRAGVL